MRKVGHVARQVLDAVLAEVQAGFTTDQLDRVAHYLMVDLGAYPSPLNNVGFPKSICTSVNEVVVHGIPDSRPPRGRRYHQMRCQRLYRWHAW